MQNWFEKITGFREESGDQVRENLVLDGDEMTSRLNGRSFRFGSLEIPSLAELRDRVKSLKPLEGVLTLREEIGDVKKFHADPSNAGALFQVASQFNLLEMVSPSAVPEDGVGIYEYDHTQGPACAIAAGAGTIFRNYFVPVNGRIGQTRDNQIDCLFDVGAALDNSNNRLWTMRNGYVQATSRSSVEEIGERLRRSDQLQLDEIRELLRIGVHSGTEVTISNSGHTVTQAFCSALPLGSYSPYSAHLWEPFARLILEGTYEATICASILNAARTGNNKVYLTLVGGGVFANDSTWIADAIERALAKHRNHALDVRIVSHSGKNMSVAKLVRRFESNS